MSVIYQSPVLPWPATWSVTVRCPGSRRTTPVVNLVGDLVSELGLFLCLWFRFVFNMEAMQKPVDDRCGDDTHCGKHRQSRIEGITPGEDFSRRGLNRGNRPHSSENHRRIEKRIQPGKIFREMVAADARKEKGKTDVSELSSDKLGSGKERIFQSFEFG
jgi:hypothetical protein